MTEEKTTATIRLDGKQDYFLCSWNGTKIVEIHTKESLFEEYKGTNLFEADAYDWTVFSSGGYKTNMSITGMMDYLILNQDVFKRAFNDNMTLMYIQIKE